MTRHPATPGTIYEKSASCPFRATAINAKHFGTMKEKGSPHVFYLHQTRILHAVSAGAGRISPSGEKSGGAQRVGSGWGSGGEVRGVPTGWGRSTTRPAGRRSCRWVARAARRWRQRLMRRRLPSGMRLPVGVVGRRPPVKPVRF